MREINEQWSILQALNGLGAAMLELGTWQEARTTFSEVLHLAWDMQALPDALSALVGLAGLHMQFGVAEQAFELLVHVSSHPASSEETKQCAERLRAQLEPQLTSQQIGAIEAQAKSFDAVVTELLCSASVLAAGIQSGRAKDRSRRPISAHETGVAR